MKTIILFAAFMLHAALSFSQGTAINNTGAAADNTAILDVSSTTKGQLIPRMTTAQRNAIISPASFLMVCNVTTNCIEWWDGIGNTWVNLSCGCQAPAQPTTGAHIPSATQIEWHWNTVSGATGYKWNTANNYSTATDNAASTSYTQTGLTCNTAYSLYVWAYNSCGNSVVATLNQSTSACFTCGNSVTFTYRGGSVTYGTVSHNSECWMDRNLGASQVATSSTDANAYGDLFQWGRLDDGHQSRTSGLTSVLSGTDNPGHSNFITSSGDWRSPLNDNLWQGVSGINNPCPAGWRVPVDDELNTERASWSSQNAAGAFGSPLKLTISGYRYYVSGVLQVIGVQSYLWSSTVDASGFGSILFFDASSANMGLGGYYRGGGMTVRCIKD